MPNDEEDKIQEDEQVGPETGLFVEENKEMVN
jgi:hypothetical protein